MHDGSAAIYHATATNNIFVQNFDRLLIALKMDSVALAPPESSNMDDFQRRDPSPNRDHSPPKKPNIRKRTKTGCLTCRKRRIKCDEGKPVCNNCNKSRRPCEGYNQRITFKNNNGIQLHGGPYGPIPFHHHPDATEALVNAQLSATQARASSSSQGPLPIIAPKPTSYDPYEYRCGNAGQFPYIDPYPGLHRASSSASLGLGIHQPQYTMSPISPESYYSQPALGMTASPTQMHQPDLFDFQVPPPQQPQPNFYVPERRHTAYARAEKPFVSPTMPFSPPNSQAQYVKREPSEQAKSYMLDDESVASDSGDEHEKHEDEEKLSINGMVDPKPENPGPLVASNLNMPMDLYGTQVRSFHSLMDDNALVGYNPSLADTPLNDPKVALVFWYFVTVTAPALSAYERNRIDPSRIFSGEPIPKSHQHIWSYVFPLQAFQHSPLLQAMLALGSLQMAELTGSALTASLVHYGLCLKRLAKYYESPAKRSQPAVLAASLLLAFYEVWISNHEKWCTHMIGARHIIHETPFRQMSRHVWYVHQQRYLQWIELQEQNPFADFMPQGAHPGHELAEVDLGLVRSLTGRPVYFMEGPDATDRQSKPRNCTERDLENYEHLADLYWWFCKMDVYQATLGGSKLFMEYDLWTQCPPRAPINRMNQIYGTFDHLILLLGRLSNFVANDLPRKHRRSTNPKSPTSPPMFAGLFPGRGNIQPPLGLDPLHASFASFSASVKGSFHQDPNQNDDEDEEDDLETSDRKALDEWHAIRAAFDLFERSLGEDFAPLSEDMHVPRESPFGTAYVYRTYGIAGIWMNFYMGLITLHRSHPSMPPFPMRAAHMVQQQTEPFATKIGKIVAGVAEDWAAESMVSTMVGAVFIECCFPLFVAAVQFRDRIQRQWAIRRLHDITRLTGWKTGDQIANGCEAAWRKAAAMNAAPPYEPESEADALQHGYTTRRIDERIQEVDEGHNERVLLKRNDRAHVAFGLLSVDEDLERLTLED